MALQGENGKESCHCEFEAATKGPQLLEQQAESIKTNKSVLSKMKGYGSEKIVTSKEQMMI